MRNVRVLWKACSDVSRTVKSQYDPNADLSLHDPIIDGGSIRVARLAARVILGFILFSFAVVAAFRELPKYLEMAETLATARAASDRPIKAGGDGAEDTAEILKQHLAERERMDLEEAERKRLRREEDERWHRANAERRRQIAEERRHEEMLAQKKRQSALLEEQHLERLAQEAAAAKARDREEKQRRTAAERRHREEMTQLKKIEKAARESNRSTLIYGRPPLIVPNKTERMMNSGPGLFERD